MLTAGLMEVFLSAHMDMDFSRYENLLMENLEVMIPLLLLKAADMNPRINATSRKLLMLSFECFNELPQFMTRTFLKKSTSGVPKQLKARAEIADELVQKYGTEDSESNIFPKSVALFAEPLLKHQNNEVREAAMKLITDMMIKCKLRDFHDFMNEYDVRMELSETLIQNIESRITRVATPKVTQQKKKDESKTIEKSNGKKDGVKKKKDEPKPKTSPKKEAGSKLAV
jgi:hypothetical protein